jgi:hypothetical protein
VFDVVQDGGPEGASTGMVGPHRRYGSSNDHWGIPMDGSGISRRRTLQLTGAAVAGVALAHVVPSRAAANPASAAGVGPIAAVSRAPDRLDIFAVASNGGVYTSGWQPGDPNFSPWQRIGTLEVAPCAPLAAVSRSTNKLDVSSPGWMVASSRRRGSRAVSAGACGRRSARR